MGNCFFDTQNSADIVTEMPQGKQGPGGRVGTASASGSRGLSTSQQHRTQQARRHQSSSSNFKPLNRERESPPALKNLNDGGASRRQHPENLTGWKDNGLLYIHNTQGKSNENELMERNRAFRPERDEARRDWENLRKQMEGQISVLQRERDEARRETEKLRQQVQGRISALQRETDSALRENEKLRRHMEERNRAFQPERDEARRDWENLRKQMETERNTHQRELQEAQREIKMVQREYAGLQARNRDLLQRLSSMASERMRFNNPCVEDLSDPNRHSAVQSKWQALMNGEYWTLYEAALHKLPNEKATSGFLLRIMELGFTETQSMVGGSGAFMNKLKDLGRNDPDMAALVDALGRQHEFRQIVDAEGRKLRKKVDSTLPPGAFEDFREKIRKGQRNVGEELCKKSHRFADEVLRLCYLMALQTPPMALVFDSPEDKEMDTLLYDPDGDRNKPKPWIVNFVLTPPLLRHEGGPILNKGTVELK